MKSPIRLTMLGSILAGFTSFLLSLSGHAAVLLSDNFESYTAGNALPTTSWGTEGGNNATYTIRDSDAFGTSNKFLEIDDTVDNNFSGAVHKTAIANNQAVTFSLDFIATNADAVIFGFSAGTNTSIVLGSDTVARIDLTNGAISGTSTTNGFGSGFFSLNTAYELKTVLNDSGATINYADRSLADNSYDVWIRDLSASGSTYVGSGTFVTAAQYYTAARSFNAPMPTTYIDNWQVEEGAIVSPIPEPSTMALLLGSLGLLALRRRS